jgi:hypothetical protein
MNGFVSTQFETPIEPEPTLLASADIGVATDAPSGIRVGRAGVPFKGPSMRDITEPAMGLLDMGAATAKGATQGFIGTPGDLESLGRLALNYMGVNVDQGTALPTTDEVKQFFDKYVPLKQKTLSDVVLDGEGVKPKTNPYEGIGELVAPGGQIKMLKPLGKVLKGAVKMTEGLPVGMSIKSANAKEFSDAIKNEVNGLELDLYESSNGNNLILSKIALPKEDRKSGIGTDVMNELVKFADSQNKTVTLSPSTDFGGTSVSRLKEFYKTFGFVENKGRNKDFSISETMYRLPVKESK